VLTQERLDVFYAEIMHGNSKFKSCWKVFKLVFTLSRGQASVERGFSINKELLTDNLEEVSLISQRMVYDYINESGKSITEIPKCNELLKSCKLSRSRYFDALELKKQQNDGESRRKKTKNENGRDSRSEREKKRAIEAGIRSMENDVEAFSIAAEEKNDISLLTKANSFSITIRSKRETLASLDNVLVKLDEELLKIKS